MLMMYKVKALQYQHPQAASSKAWRQNYVDNFKQLVRVPYSGHYRLTIGCLSLVVITQTLYIVSIVCVSYSKMLQSGGTPLQLPCYVKQTFKLVEKIHKNNVLARR